MGLVPWGPKLYVQHVNRAAAVRPSAFPSLPFSFPPVRPSFALNISISAAHLQFPSSAEQFRLAREPARNVRRDRSILNLEARGMVPTTAVEEALGQVRDQIHAVETLKSQRWTLINETESRRIDHTIASTQRVVARVEAHRPTSRRDVEGGNGDPQALQETADAVRSNGSAEESLMQLSIASQTLAAAVALLCHHPSTPAPGPAVSDLPEVYETRNKSVRSPPTYEESEFLNAARARNLKRRLVGGGPPLSASKTHIAKTPARGGDTGRRTPVELHAEHVKYELDAVGNSLSPPRLELSAEVEDGAAPKLVGRARSRRWLQAHTESSGAIVSGNGTGRVTPSPALDHRYSRVS